MISEWVHQMGPGLAASIIPYGRESKDLRDMMTASKTEPAMAGGETHVRLVTKIRYGTIDANREEPRLNLYKDRLELILLKRK